MWTSSRVLPLNQIVKIAQAIVSKIVIILLGSNLNVRVASFQ